MVHAEQVLMESLRASNAGDVVDMDDLPQAHAKDIYFKLLDPQPTESALEQSRLYLLQQLDTVTGTGSDLPADINDLFAWMRSNTATVSRQYQEYLAGRHNGGPRRYFPTKSHALHFLKAVAPTKLVDGAWLYGVVAQWRDARFSELIRIYLEELGEGDPGQNHVLLYKKLLAAHECDQWQSLDDSYFVQGAIQLSLAQHARHFLPEVIGFNLGYEQLPLHLLICAYELNELGIEPYYFTLHVTIDNAASGHAARAVQAVIDAMPRVGDQNAFYQRIRNGYQLNALGTGTTQAIADFDLDQDAHEILAAKASVGAALHSDYCRVAGKTINEWLSTPGQIRGFVQALEKSGWIKRNDDPENSRFWKLLQSDKAPMFGVFSAYERQLIHDWIAGDSLGDPADSIASYRVQARKLGVQAGESEPRTWHAGAYAGSRGGDHSRQSDDFNSEARLLNNRLARAADADAVMDALVPWLGPAQHHTAAGLLATRVFAQRLRG